MERAKRAKYTLEFKQEAVRLVEREPRAETDAPLADSFDPDDSGGDAVGQQAVRRPFPGELADGGEVEIGGRSRETSSAITTNSELSSFRSDN